VKTFPKTTLADLLERDIGTVGRALRTVKPDATEKGISRWKIVTALKALGALPGSNGAAPSRRAEPSPNIYWQVRSFRNYADYALTAPFAAGLARLRERGGEHRCVIMCAEAVWWRCHRRIIADYLLAADERVMHILGKSHVDVASLTPGAVVRNDGTVVYPAVAELPRPEPDQAQPLGWRGEL